MAFCLEGTGTITYLRTPEMVSRTSQQLSSGQRSYSRLCSLCVAYDTTVYSRVSSNAVSKNTASFVNVRHPSHTQVSLAERQNRSFSRVVSADRSIRIRYDQKYWLVSSYHVVPWHPRAHADLDCARKDSGSPSFLETQLLDSI
jgi:hypothetical protein